MKRHQRLVSVITATSLLCGAGWAVAQHVDPDTLPKVSCSDLIYSQQFLKKYPKAPAACLEARVAHGLRYAKFSGKVYIPGADVITVQVFNVAGDPLLTFSFKPAANARIILDGKPTAFSALHAGDPVTFWVSEKRFSVYTAPGEKHGVSQAVAPR